MTVRVEGGGRVEQRLGEAIPESVGERIEQGWICDTRRNETSSEDKSGE